jgi:glycosyltransferase involved in cell wall biosynthesis
VASIGRIAPEKGQREFVEAAALIRQALPECRFVIYGAALFAEPGAQRYDAEIRAAGAQVGVEFPGWVADVQPALAQTDLLLVPSAGHEATTRVILEAHAAGVPVIAFRSGGIPEVVEHGRDGWLVDSTAEMARLAVELLGGSRETLAAVGRQGRESWERKFTLQRYHEELFAALECAVG